MTRPVSILATHEVINLVTVCVCPPIPCRDYDWAAFDDNDCSCIDCHLIQGHGRTEADAINEFFDELEAA